MDILSKIKAKVKSVKTLETKPKTAVSILVAALCLAIGFGAKHFTGKDDSAPEQLAEAVLEYYNIDIDFTPDDDDTVKPDNS
jgi:hypothetical protein